MDASRFDREHPGAQHQTIINRTVENQKWEEIQISHAYIWVIMVAGALRWLVKLLLRHR